MTNKTAVYDCSNSSNRPVHRGGGGPVQNDIMRYLVLHGKHYGLQFTHSISEADVIITNDVFTYQAVASGKPLIKRMDGVFFQEELLERNILLNRSANCADHVVFISQFSQNSLQELYPGVSVRSQSVGLNAADPWVFYPKPKKLHQAFTWAASATDWRRQEKRKYALMQMAISRPQDQFILIGHTSEEDLPSNVTATGYLKSPKAIALALNQCDAYVHLAYRDAAPKTVAQALSAGLPVLYANSGGCPELVGQFGIAVDEAPLPYIPNFVPDLPFDNLSQAIDRFMLHFANMKASMVNFPSKKRFREMIISYARACRCLR